MSELQGIAWWWIAGALVVWLLCGVAAGNIAEEKGYAHALGCAAGLILGVFGLLWVGFLPDRKAQRDLSVIREMLLSELERGYHERRDGERTEETDGPPELWSLKTKSKGY